MSQTTDVVRSSLLGIRNRLSSQLRTMEDALAIARQLEIGPGQFLDAVNQLEEDCGAIDDALDRLAARPNPSGGNEG